MAWSAQTVENSHSFRNIVNTWYKSLAMMTLHYCFNCGLQTTKGHFIKGQRRTKAVFGPLVLDLPE